MSNSWRLSSEVVERLLPHRAPFRMVDVVTGFETGEAPRLTAFRNISANEPVFAGHFPGFHLWPGAYTIEGLAQATALLAVLQRLTEKFAAAGLDGALPQALQSLDPRRRLAANWCPDPNAALLDDLTVGYVGVIADVQIRLLAPVFAGDRIDYDVRRTRMLGPIVRFAVEASVAGTAVAKGTLTGAPFGGAP